MRALILEHNFQEFIISLENMRQQYYYHEEVRRRHTTTVLMLET